MMTDFNFRPLEELMADELRDFAERQKRLAARRSRFRKGIEAALAACPELAGNISAYDQGADVHVDLGERPRKGERAKALFVKKFRAVRAAFGAFGPPGTDVADAKRKLVRFQYRLKGEDGSFYLYFNAKLQRSDRCKIVVTRSTSTRASLVCGAPAPQE